MFFVGIKYLYTLLRSENQSAIINSNKYTIHFTYVYTGCLKYYLFKSV